MAQKSTAVQGNRNKTKKKLRRTLYISNLVHNTIVHRIVHRQQPGHPVIFEFFWSIFPNTDPMKHGINAEINL